MNKRTFVVELTSENDSLNALTKEDFDYIMKRGLYEYMGNFFAQNVQVKNVEQNVERPIPEERGEKALALSGNLAWENRIEDGDDYLGDRMNDLLER